MKITPNFDCAEAMAAKDRKIERLRSLADSWYSAGESWKRGGRAYVAESCFREAERLYDLANAVIMNNEK